MKTDKLIETILDGETWLIKENSNTQLIPSTLDLLIASKAKEEYVLKKFYSRDVSKHHKTGPIYIHDLHSPFKPYCNGIDARIFLLDGLRFPHCASTPARHFSSAIYHSMAYLFYSQLFFAGAQAMDYFNWFLAPYLRCDKLKDEELKQILQGLAYQLNQSNRTGAQSAFTNIGMRIKCPSYLESVPVVYSGKRQKETYEDFEDEARRIYAALMEIMGEGDGNGAPFTFPIITTAITKDLDWDDELVDKTMETTSRTGAPYFFNLTTDYLDERYVHAMCCRLIVEHSGGVWMAGGLGTGSNKVVTLNLPHIALTSKNEDQFFEMLEGEMETAKKALEESNHIIKKSLEEWKLLPLLEMKTREGAPYYNFDERRLTFGMIGLNECLLNLINKPLVSDEGWGLGIKIVKSMAEKIKKFTEEGGTVYTLEQTPAESATFKLATNDRKTFGRKAHVQGRGAGVYYTNSTHVPYNEDITLHKKIEIESEFHPYFSGGVISHIWIGESSPSPAGVKNLVRELSKTKLAYFTFSPDFSVCENDHLSRGKLEKCPKCGSEIIDNINRIVGYFTRTSRWNPGKQEEYRERKRFPI